MVFRTLRARAFVAASCATLALSACVPIPYATSQYVANGADVTLNTTAGSGCGFGSDKGLRAERQIGTVEIFPFLLPKGRTSANSNADFRIAFSQGPTSRPLSIAMNPARVKLQESGRSFTAKLTDKYENSNSEQRKHNVFEFSFAAPSGVGQTARVVFEPGALVIGGRAVAFAPIRYTLETNTAVYMFPCIPT